jgi:hypothetical protein
MRYLLKGKRMNFNDYIISESDYSFFDSLPEDEKLLFMYDLICEESYGTGSENYEDPEDRYDTSEIKPDLAKFDDIVDAFKSKLQTIVAASISEKAPVNMMFLNDKLIINSESLALIADTVNQMILTGYILSEQTLTKPQRKIFHQQKYCKVYTMLGKVNRISEN